MNISLVVAVDLARGIGFHNQLLCHLPADLQYFKQVTWGKPILMGRKTFESIGRPLPGRQNIVLSHAPLAIEGVTHVPTLEAAWEHLQDASEIMVIGGAQVFAQTLPLASQIYMTEIQHTFVADTVFPAFETMGFQREIVKTHPADEKNAYAMVFYRWYR